MTHQRHAPATPDRGFTLIEMMIALVIISIGVLAVAQMFPTGSRAQVRDHLLTSANNYAQERIEDLSTRQWSDTALSVGRHPSATGTLSLGPNGEWHLCYDVSQMAAPLNNLKKVAVTVSYQGAGMDSSRSVIATTYIRQ